MISDELAKEWQDKLTREESLSSEEEQVLEQWNASQEDAESQTLAKSSEESWATILENQVNTALIQLMFLTKPKEKMMASDEALKKELIQL